MGSRSLRSVDPILCSDKSAQNASPLAGDALAAWVAASCERHGVPLKVSDPTALANVVVLLGVSVGRRRALQRRRQALELVGSNPPDDIDAPGIEVPGANNSGADRDVVDDRCDDCVVPVEGQVGPLSA